MKGADIAVLKTTSAPETAAERARRLMAEAQQAGDELVAEMLDAAQALRAMILDVVRAGECVPVGVRECAAHMGAELDSRAQTIEAIMRRVGE